MSRFENIQYIPCGRCCAEIGYDRGADWSAVSDLVNEHWRACPAKPLAKPAGTTHTLTSPLDRTIVLPPPVTSDQGSSPSLVAGVGSPSHTWISSGCERKRRTLEQRKLELEQDEYAENITTKSVVCKGCRKEISLDKRSKYYPGLWNKHKGKCHSIEKLERARAKTPQAPNGTRPAPCDVIIPGFGSHGYGGVLQLGPAVRYEDHSAGHTHRLVRHYEDPSSDDEEDEDVQTHEPFPTLNNIFYRTQSCDHSGVWAYRYATKEEITTNVFRGQDEPYARLDTGARPFGYLSLQAGDCCDVLRCVIKNQVERGDSHPGDTEPARERRRPDKDSAGLHTLSWRSDPSPY